MPLVRFPRLLLTLFAASVGLNLWQFLRPQPSAAEQARQPVSSSIARNASVAGRTTRKASPAKSEEAADVLSPEEFSGEKLPPDQQSEDQLIYGAVDSGNHLSIHGEPAGKISPQRLTEMAKMPVSKAGRFRVHARLHLPGDRVADLGDMELGAGQRIKFERLKEFPFPTSVRLATADPVPGTSFPVTPTTPGDFEFRNRGIEVELDVTPAPGTLVLGGNVRQTVVEEFNRMPGEVFSPMWEGDVLLTENKFLQPQFTTRESPFVAAAEEGKPVEVPVHTSFGQSVLELTCTPLD